MALGECAVSYKIIKNKSYFSKSHSGEDKEFAYNITKLYKNTCILPLILSYTAGQEHIRIIDGKVHTNDIVISDYAPQL